MWVCPCCHFSVSPLLVEGSASKGKARPNLCLRKSLARGRAHGGRERTASPRVYFSPRKAQQNLEGGRASRRRQPYARASFRAPARRGAGVLRAPGRYVIPTKHTPLSVCEL